MRRATTEDFPSVAAGRVEEAYKVLGSVLDEFARLSEAEVEQQLITDNGIPTHAELGVLAKEMLNERRLRDRIIRQAFFGEPVWDLLLSLFVAHSVGQPLTVSAACASAGCPQTTALRYIDQLEVKGLLDKSKSEGDKRMIFVQMTRRCLDLMVDYLTRVEESRSKKKPA